MDVLTDAASAMAIAFLKAQGYFVDILWSVSDIHNICEDQGWPPLEFAECMEIFAECQKRFDGEHGLSWPLLVKMVKEHKDKKLPQEA